LLALIKKGSIDLVFEINSKEWKTLDDYDELTAEKYIDGIKLHIKVRRRLRDPPEVNQPVFEGY